MLSVVLGRSFLRSRAVQTASKQIPLSYRALSTNNGYPYPDNIALASELESVVRVNGGVPATIGILDGVAHVGMNAEQIIQLAASAGKDTTLKLSRRDLSFVSGMRLTGKHFNGGTTIAGTMILAQLAGIRVFATGGLGGVHRGAESSMDISADLTELGRTPVAVVSSGCKSFLDIPRTIEYLETEGVGIATFADGRDGKVDFPAFWSRDSGVKSPVTIENEREAAAIIYAQMKLPVASGLLFANPIPTEWAIPKAEMEIIIHQAIREADAAGITGKDNTPFILNKVKELSGGKSLPANRALIVSNVKRGTNVAKELANFEMMLDHEGSNVSREHVQTISVADLQPRARSTVVFQSSQSPAESLQREPTDVVVAGALAIDYSCDHVPFDDEVLHKMPQMHTSNPSSIRQSLGGVAHNVAKAAYYLLGNVRLISAVGDDLPGKTALQQLDAEGMQTSGIKTINGARTAQYVAVNDVNKDLVLAMADMGILEHSQSMFPAWQDELLSARPKWFVADANWDARSLQLWFQTAKSAGIRTAFEPVSTAKSIGLFTPTRDAITSEAYELPVWPKHLVDVATPNTYELASMHAAASSNALLEREDWWSIIDSMGIPSSGARTRFARSTSGELVDEGIPQQSVQLLPFIPTIVTKLGSRGALLTMLLHKDDNRLWSEHARPYIVSRTHGEDSESQVGGIYMRLFPPAEIVAALDIVSVNGVGDTFLGALIASLVKTDRGIEEMVDFAQKAAVLTLKSQEAVSPDLRKLKGSFL
ncbi:IdgA domain-containing protein [Venturia nashicola]|nr:IdgA domain-containing protein [Venturia nashicola]